MEKVNLGTIFGPGKRILLFGKEIIDNTQSIFQNKMATTIVIPNVTALSRNVCAPISVSVRNAFIKP